MAKRVDARLRYAKLIGKFLLAAFILFGAYGGARVYYLLFLQTTGVALADKRPLSRFDLTDMVIIDTVQKSQIAAQTPAPAPVQNEASSTPQTITHEHDGLPPHTHEIP